VPTLDSAGKLFLKIFIYIELLNAIESRLQKLKFQNERANALQALNKFYEEIKNEDALGKLTETNDISLYKKKQTIYAEEDLAHIAGTTTESLIRTLSDFRNEKLVEAEIGYIKVLNEKKLLDMIN